MQIRFAALGVLAALSAGMTLLAPAAAQKAQVSEAQSRFAFMPPVGWQVTTKHAPYRLLCIAQSSRDDAATLSVQETLSSLPVDRYVSKLLKTLTAASPSTRSLSRGVFVTHRGLHGYRAAFDRTTPEQGVHFVLYAFSGAGHQRFLCAGIWPAAENARYEAAADASMKTFAVNSALYAQTAATTAAATRPRHRRLSHTLSQVGQC